MEFVFGSRYPMLHHQPTVVIAADRRKGPSARAMVKDI
jgi:hypothetical protein